MRNGALFLLVALVVPRAAWGEEEYIRLIPNGENPVLGGIQSCVICHIRPQGDGDRNAFGTEFDRGGQDWSRIWDLDSDGDGQTNGFELGDPNGVWEFGATPARTQNLSFPGDPTSKVDMAGGDDAGPADMGGPVDAGDPSDTDREVGPPGDGARDASVDSGVGDAGVRDAGARDVGIGGDGGSSEGSGCRCVAPSGRGCDPADLGLAAVVLGLFVSAGSRRRTRA